MGLERTERVLDFLRAHKAQTVPHSGSTYWAHVVGVARLLSSWKPGDAMYRVGLLHSVYSSGGAQGEGVSLDDRPKVRELLGQRCEELVYLNCVLDLKSLEKVLRDAVESYWIVNRLGGDRSAVSRARFDDLCRVRLADRLEQAPRVPKWSGPPPDVFLRMAQRLGGPALETFERVYRAAKPLDQRGKPDGMQV
jgi:(p)ppGpp synthase/HD superfamily hydrolase